MGSVLTMVNYNNAAPQVGFNNFIGNNMLGLGNNFLGNNMLGMGTNVWNNLWGNNMLSRQLLSGRFVMRLQPGDSMFMDRYMAVWGVDEEMNKQMKETNPPMEIMISEDGNEMTMSYGEWSATMRFGQMSTMMNPMIGKEQSCTVFMTSPNSFTIETFTFNAVGVQVNAMASKGLNNNLRMMSNSATFNYMMERVDEDNNAAPLGGMGWVG